MSNNVSLHKITVDASERMGRLRPIWRSFGYDEINWTYTPRGKRLFQTIGELSKEGTYFVRNHHALSSGNGLSTPTKGSCNVYSEDTDGKPIYNFSLLDQVYETFLQNNCKPIIELGFMPDALSRGPKPRLTYQHEGNDLWKYPPKDYRKWEALVYQTVKHCVDQYGSDEVNAWYWELWNEPDCSIYFKGSVKDYCTLYDHSVAGAVRALPTIKIGGPALACRAKFLDKFLAHCAKGKNSVTGKRGSRLDFISFHAKGTDWPRLDQLTEEPSLRKILAQLEEYRQVLGKYPQYENHEILFDECDMTVATNFGIHDYPFFRFNNTEYFPVFVIRQVKNILDYMMLKKMNLKFFTTWAFYFEGKRFFEGNRALVTNENIKKPVFNAFGMLEKLGDTRIGLHGGSGMRSLSSPDFSRRVDGLATLTRDRSMEVLLWNFDEDPDATGEAEIELSVKNPAFSMRRAKIFLYRIDNQHSNAYAAWCELGSPQDPSPEQLEVIRGRESLEMVESPKSIEIGQNGFRKRFRLPMHGAMLLKIEASV